MKLVVPDVRQGDGHDCGTACLSMLFQFHRHPIPNDLNRPTLPHEAMGPDAIVAVLHRAWGSNITRCRMTPQILCGGYLRDHKPVLCLMTFEGWLSDHWVVATGFAGGRIYFNCPTEGAKSLPTYKFIEAWRDAAGELPQLGVTGWPIG